MSSMRTKVAALIPGNVKSKLRGVVHPAQRYAFARATGKRARNLGTLSVVIPVFNVESYLSACLDSVISQSYPHLDIIVVDDGSTDGSLLIAQQYARWDKRIRVVSLKHGGNGRARNLAIKEAQGPFLTFADSDDVVASNAYQTMMGKIAASGSDFVVGSSDRLIGKRRISTKQAARLHAVERTAITLNDFPAILDDVFLWNKVFRKTFWDLSVGLIPEGILYEDQETTARAYIRATKFDVLAENVYSWRQRPDGNSITQGKGTLTNLQDRLAVADNVTRLLLTEASQVAIEVWFKRLFGSDLLPYFDLVANAGHNYWQSLRDGVRSIRVLFDRAQIIREEIWQGIDPHARVFLDLTEASLVEDVHDVIVSRIDSGTGYAVDIAEGVFFAKPSYWDELKFTQKKVPPICTAQLLTFDSCIRLWEMPDGQGLVLRGYGFIRGLHSRPEFDSITVELALSNGSRLPVDVRRFCDTRIDLEANDPFASHESAAFEVILKDPNILSTVVGAKISLAVAGAMWSMDHWLKIGEQIVALNQRPSPYRPHVVSCEVYAATESFTIDVDWGNGTASNYVYLSTAEAQIDPVSIKLVDPTIHRYLFELPHLHWDEKVFSYPSGSYTLRYKSKDSPSAKSIDASALLRIRYPSEHTFDHSNLTFRVTTASKFAVTIVPPYEENERSKFHQRLIQKSFKKVQEVSTKEHIVVESFSGTQTTDSPLAIAKQILKASPATDIYISLADYSVPYPNELKPIIRGTAQWHKKVQSARALINNNNFPYYFEKNPKQIYLQTWHGTPLKTIGDDAPIHYISPSYRRVLQKESTQWDYLLAADKYTADIFSSAFPRAKNTAIIGSPKNDSLLNEKDRRIKTRLLLKISPHQSVVLYAPTWRDSAREGNTFSNQNQLIDLGAFAEKLGSGYKVLFRGHHNVQSSQTMSLRGNILDVSGYPHVNDLIQASDILISDYSSIIVDYHISKKPVILYVPDLEEYRDEIRGLYCELSNFTNVGEFRTQQQLIEKIVEWNFEHNSQSGIRSPSASSSEDCEYKYLDDGKSAERAMKLLPFVAASETF